jgi:hypothetical protein
MAESIYEDETEQAEVSRNPNRPVMSGHCAFPQTAHPEQSHERCGRNGGGARANRQGGWHPCPCSCHLGDAYECGNCGRLIAEAPLWEGTGEMVYVHLDGDGRSIGEDCP